MVNTEIKLVTFFVAEDGEGVYSQKKSRPGADCGSNHQLFVAKFRLKLKKVGKTTRPVSYQFSPVQFSSVAQSCPTLCDPMNHSTPGLPVHHQLPEFT